MCSDERRGQTGEHVVALQVGSRKDGQALAREVIDHGEHSERIAIVGVDIHTSASYTRLPVVVALKNLEMLADSAKLAMNACCVKCGRRGTFYTE